MSRFEDEASRLRALASNRRTRIRYTKHAEEELIKDDIAKIDVENMLRRCRVTLVEQKQELTWRAEGTDSDGRKIAAVVVAEEDVLKVKVVTGWAVRKGR